MRKWHDYHCGECGRDDGYWEDVAELPESPEAYAARIKEQEFWNAVFGPRIKDQLEQDSTFSKVTARIKLSQQMLDDAGTVTFPIRRTRDA